MFFSKFFKKGKRAAQEQEERKEALQEGGLTEEGTGAEPEESGLSAEGTGAAESEPGGFSGEEAGAAESEPGVFSVEGADAAESEPGGFSGEGTGVAKFEAGGFSAEGTGAELEESGFSAEGTGTEPEAGGFSAEGTGAEPEESGFSAEGTGAEPEESGFSAEGTGAEPEESGFSAGKAGTALEESGFSAEGTGTAEFEENGSSTGEAYSSGRGGFSAEEADSPGIEGFTAAGAGSADGSGSWAEREAALGKSGFREESDSPSDTSGEESDSPSAVSEGRRGGLFGASGEEAAGDTSSGVENAAAKKKKGFFARLKEGLAKTRDNIVRGIDSLFNGFTAIDDDFYEELEEILIMGDIGVNATTEIVARLKEQVKERHLKEPKECKQLLIEGIKEQMRVDAAAYDFEKKQSVIMVIGVNGVGKTTSVGKLAGKLKEDGRKVLIAAADTFRAAAGDQLAEWARRADVPMVGGREGADPASVVFDAVNAAKARGVDVLLVDTAGRLHNKKNLMEELRKMNRIIDREFPDAHRENLIVLDGTTGQNALVQAREFGSVAQLTGIILTKMDGTAKGGIAVAIQSELRVPVKYIGVGETIDDLQKFDSDEFVNALFDVKPDGGDE